MAESLVQHQCVDIEISKRDFLAEGRKFTLEETDSQVSHLRERRAILCDGPQTLGASWARGWFQTMRTEGRRVSGGWPGTIPEARFRARLHCDRELSIRGLPLLSQDELLMVTAATYERAKRDWLRAVREGKVPHPSKVASKA